MARPLRPQWRVRTMVRRRHRTWVASMILATVGWGIWWTSLVLHKLLPELGPGAGPTYVVTGVLAVAGLALAVLTVRARLIWVLLAGVPLFANGTLLLLPAVFGDEVAELLAPPAGGATGDGPAGAEPSAR